MTRYPDYGIEQGDPEDHPIQVIRDCPICKTTRSVVVHQLSYQQWREGRMLIQAAFPDLSANDREHLLTGLCLTGLCASCWDTRIAKPLRG